MTNLTDLGQKYGTDKVDQWHEFLGDKYTDIYHRYLNHLRDKEFNLLEIGVRDGKSMKMWSEYFPKAKIIGVDIDPTCKQYETGNVEIHIGSQEDKDFVNKIIDQYGEFAVVLDDGSHINSMTIKSFQLLNNYTTDFYIIEDLRNSYEDLTIDVQSWPGIQYNKDLDANNYITRPAFNKMVLDLIQMMDYRTGNWSGFYWHAQMLIMQKGNICGNQLPCVTLQKVE